MREKKEPSEANVFRMEIGCQLIDILAENEELPMPNVDRLARTMQEYFTRLGMIDDVKERGYRWKPDVDYWKLKMSDITTRLRVEYGKYFGYTYKPGQKCTEGDWKFMTPKEWEKTLRIKHSDIGTRIETQNGKIDESLNDYKVDMPHIKEVPLLN